MKYIYSPETYFELSKFDYLHPFKQKQQSDMDNDLALGGLYEIISVVDNLCILDPGNFYIHKEDLIPYDPTKYSFNEGNIVKEVKNEKTFTCSIYFYWNFTYALCIV
ncbi:MAG: hypothetical protein P1P64_00435 [Treponemataceae bacterium]